MKVTKQVGQAPVFEFEASSPKEIFEKLALLDSLFTEDSCGCCGSKEIIYFNRPVDNGSYLELRCQKCRAQLSFGQNKDGKGIFAKRWDKDTKQPLPNRGWYVYHKQGDQQEPQPARAFGGQSNLPSPGSDDIPF